MSGFGDYLHGMTARVIGPLVSLGTIVAEAGRRRRAPIVLPLAPVAKPPSTVVKFRRYRDPAHLNPERVPGGAVILSFPRRCAKSIDPNEPRAHAS